MPEPGQTLAKATIKNLDTDEEVECIFRPKEYTLKKTNKWVTKEVTGQNVPAVEFSGGESQALTMELFFDTYEADKDVRDYTKKIWKMMEIDEKQAGQGNKGRPPHVEFRWGKAWSFRAVITSLSQRFTLFHMDGRPARTTLNVSFKQVADEGKHPPQNPTTVSKPGYKTRRVKEGETLDWIAFDEYKDAKQWRMLADVNGLDDPMKIEPGQVLAIAPIK